MSATAEAFERRKGNSICTALPLCPSLFSQPDGAALQCVHVCLWDGGGKPSRGPRVEGGPPAVCPEPSPRRSELHGAWRLPG